MSNSAAAEANAATVRAWDYERYLAALFAPEPSRRDLFALYAWAAEIDRVPEVVREPILGEIRLHWWREALEAAEQGTRAGQPEADGLADLLPRLADRRADLHGFIDVRAFDLSASVMPDHAALLADCDKREGALLRLSATLLAGRSLIGAEQAACQAAGIALGLTRRLARTGADLERGRIWLPASDLTARLVPIASLAEPERPEGVSEVMRDLVSLAEANRADAVRRLAALPAVNRTRLRPAFLPLASLPRVLATIARDPLAPFRHAIVTSPLYRVRRIVIAGLTGRI